MAKTDMRGNQKTGGRRQEIKPRASVRDAGPGTNFEFARSTAKSESGRSEKSFLRGETAGGEPFFKERSHCQKLDLCARESW